MKSVLFTCGLLLSMTINAATIRVNDNSDDTLSNLAGDGKCSLREAIHSANTGQNVDLCVTGGGADTIVFDANVSSITLAGEPLSVIGDLTISGRSPSDLVTINGNGQSRIFSHADGNGSLDLFNLLLAGGKTTGSGTVNCAASGGSGAAVCSMGYLRVENVYFLNNQATGSNARGGAVSANKQLTVNHAYFFLNKSTQSHAGAIYLNAVENSRIDNTVFSENTAETYGGGISAFVANDKTLTINNSEFKNNESKSAGGAISANDISNGHGRLLIEQSSFTQNESHSIGGAVFASLPLTLHNSTLDKNKASSNAAGIYLGSNGTHYLIHNTIVNNTVTEPTTYKNAGLYYSGANTFRLINNILSGNTDANGAAECYLQPSPNNYARNNVIFDSQSACGLSNNINQNLIGSDPKIGALSTTDGCAQKIGLDNSAAKCAGFIPLLANSPAIDHAANSAVTNISHDQRGLKRDIDGDNNGTIGADVGASEYGARPKIYAVKVGINSLAGPLTLLLNSEHHLGMSAGSTGNPYSGTATFSQKLSDTEAYTVAVSSAPEGQTCKFSNGSASTSGTVAAADVTLTLNCNTKAVYINYNPNPANGTLSCPNTGQSLYGDSPTCTATPDVGYEVDSWGDDCAGIRSGNTCTFINITENKSISVTFKQVTVVYVNYIQPQNGSLSCSKEQLTPGQDSTCTATPNTGYEVDSWGGDCATIGTGNTCTLANIQSDKSVSVTFKVKPSAAMPFKDSFE